jgi:hypothetical protein
MFQTFFTRPYLSFKRTFSVDLSDTNQSKPRPNFGVFMLKKNFVICIIFCFIFIGQAHAGQSQQERELEEKINELIETMKERGQEVKKIIYLTQPIEKLKITELTEKIVKSLTV